ncbi:DUF2063 domain-containing protein [Parashewanella curva]|uniref:DUF2063 domain-containing protein n=1 Tax=Parashewanella curva TaxID=2338552 RepID=A0A3L8Q2H8_9GAMM|nr:putative DNA-binding domain-containing protein [Parashewanella curva]RLV61023.1 DUF2063 domain-containing protein [Parashewanella curva]
MQFIDVQNEFMAFIRDPSRPLPAGMTEKRMKVYSELFFNNVHNFVSSGFPVLKSLYEEEDWNVIVRDFFINHDCHTPIFAEIAEEFLVFLQTRYQTKDTDPAFMLELAHYEWLELVVSIAQSRRNLEPLSVDDITEKPLCLSDFARIAQYSYDVQHIDEDYQPSEPLEVPAFFCVFRDKQEEVRFLSLTPLTAQVLSYIEQAETTNYDELVAWLAGVYPQMEKENIQQGCLQLLTQMVEKEIVMTQ